MRFHASLVGDLLILGSDFAELLWKLLDRSELTPELSRAVGVGLNELLCLMARHWRETWNTWQ